jgi:hypothetical protein
MDRRPSRAKTTAAKSHLQKICVLATHTFLMTNLKEPADAWGGVWIQSVGINLV